MVFGLCVLWGALFCRVRVCLSSTPLRPQKPHLQQHSTTHTPCERTCVTLQLSIIVAANGLPAAPKSAALGRPVASMMRSSWFIVLEPGNTGRPLSISPRMQPL
jgi:hypothetical protein